MGNTLRYTGENGEITLLNSTTGEQLLPSMAIESFDFNFPFDLVQKDFIGNNGPTFREFADGYEFNFKLQPNNGAEVVDYVNALKAKAEGTSADEFAAQVRLKSPGLPTIQVTFRDMHFSGNPFSVGGRKEFLTLDQKTKGTNYKIAVI